MGTRLSSMKTTHTIDPDNPHHHHKHVHHPTPEHVSHPPPKGKILMAHNYCFAASHGLGLGGVVVATLLVIASLILTSWLTLKLESDVQTGTDLLTVNVGLLKMTVEGEKGNEQTWNFPSKTCDKTLFSASATVFDCDDLSDKGKLAFGLIAAALLPAVAAIIFTLGFLIRPGRVVCKLFSGTKPIGYVAAALEALAGTLVAVAVILYSQVNRDVRYVNTFEMSFDAAFYAAVAAAALFFICAALHIGIIFLCWPLFVFEEADDDESIASPTAQHAQNHHHHHHHHQESSSTTSETYSESYSYSSGSSPSDSGSYWPASSEYEASCSGSGSYWSE